jgi:hypothetical protein
LIINSATDFLFSISSKMKVMTLGIIPYSSSFIPVQIPEPIVCVFPDPVCPYASTVALNPEKQPSTKFFTVSS